MWLIAFATVFCLSLQRTAVPDDDDTSRIKRWHALYQQRAEALVVTEKQEFNTLKLTLFPKSIQAYSNSVRPDGVHGTIHIWVNEGRPRMIAGIWSALDEKVRTQRNLCYEFHSLSESPLSATLENNLAWAPNEAGVDWIRLKEMSVPAKSRPLRLAQMRQQMSDLRGEVQSGESELRLLTQPIYRYPETVRGAIDGAIFSFVMGTDPEIFVVMEARVDQPDNEPKWFMAPIRFTGSGLKLMRGDTIIWQRPVWEIFARDKIYDFLYGVEHLDAELPAGDVKSQ